MIVEHCGEGFGGLTATQRLGAIALAPTPQSLFACLRLQPEVAQSATLAKLKTPRAPPKDYPPPVQRGAMVGDRFEILDEAGSGGMGTVYRARSRDGLARGAQDRARARR
jgi:hypothetical protein